MLKFIRKFFEKTEEATAIEYALIASLIAVACIVAFQTTGSNLSNSMDNITNSIDTTGEGSNNDKAAASAYNVESIMNNVAKNAK